MCSYILFNRLSKSFIECLIILLITNRFVYQNVSILEIVASLATVSVSSITGRFTVQCVYFAYS